MDGFADGELPRREAFGYPPFGLLARLLVADPDPKRAESRATDAAAAVPARGWEVLGPVPAWVPRRAGRWRWQIVVRGRHRSRAGAAMERVPPGVGIDVDPGRCSSRRRWPSYNAAMVIRRILTADEPILREKTKKVTDFDASLHRLLDDLLETMRMLPASASPPTRSASCSRSR